MKNFRPIFWLAAIIALGASLAVAQEEGYPFRLSNFWVEIYGGYAPLNLEHLNSLAGYEDAYLQYYYLQRYASYRPAYTVTTERSGDAEFRGIDGAALWGGRLHYQLSPTLSLSFGAQYLKGKQDSRAGMNASVRDAETVLLTDRYENTGFGLSVSALIAQMGAHFGWNFGPVFRPGIFILLGPMFAECRSVNGRHIARTGPDGYASDIVETYEMKGRKAGLSGELGVSLHIRLAKFLELCTEGSYFFRVADELLGPGSSRTIINDSISGQSDISLNWEGKWRLAPYSVVKNWGYFTGYVPSNANDWGPNYRRFTLDLSGFQVKAGIAFRL